MKFFRLVALLFFLLFTTSTAQETESALVFSVGAGWMGQAGMGASFAIEGFFPGVGLEIRAGSCGGEANVYAGSEIYTNTSARVSVGAAYRFTGGCLIFPGTSQGWSLLARLGLEYRLFFATQFSLFLEYGFVSYWIKDGTEGSLLAGLRYRF